MVAWSILNTPGLWVWQLLRVNGRPDRFDDPGAFLFPIAEEEGPQGSGKRRGRAIRCRRIVVITT
jgi:hypothetical protein